MALDGIFLYKLKEELKSQIGTHVDKIYQPSKDELVFLLRGKNGAKRLNISSAPGRTYLNLTESKTENPQNPPMFCMLLRKHIGSARLCDIIQDGFERIITFVFSSSNEMGDIVYPKLICEMISAAPNIILCGDDGKIIDAARYSNLESAARVIHPGAVYTPPEKQNKLNIMESTTELLTEKILSESTLSLSSALLKILDGFSPNACREISFRITESSDIPIQALTSAQRMNVSGILNTFKAEIKNGKSYVITDAKGEVKDFCFTEITYLGGSHKNIPCASFSNAVEKYFFEKAKTSRIKKESEDILKLIANLHSRTSKKMLLREQEALKCKDREKYRIYGELIKANLYRLKNGMNGCKLENYYDENLSEIYVPLDPAASPAANADRYFKEYKKSFSAERMLSSLIEKDKKDLIYFESVLDALSRAETVAEINDIREELRNEGYIKQFQNQKVKNNTKPSPPKEFFFNGFKISVGKNNRQNEYLSLTLADKNDIWLHTKNIAGSHVIIFCNSNEPDDSTIIYAAELAAYYSKAQKASNVAVDYTYAKFLKKPSGSKTGMVTYSKNRTVFVNPDSHESNI